MTGYFKTEVYFDQPDKKCSENNKLVGRVGTINGKSNNK
jgi:hypothetical protein